MGAYVVLRRGDRTWYQVEVVVYLAYPSGIGVVAEVYAARISPSEVWTALGVPADAEGRDDPHQG